MQKKRIAPVNGLTQKPDLRLEEANNLGPLLSPQKAQQGLKKNRLRPGEEEQHLVLHKRVAELLGNDEGMVIAFAGVSSDEGISKVACGYALAVAGIIGKRILLIDAKGGMEDLDQPVEIKGRTGWARDTESGVRFAGAIHQVDDGNLYCSPFSLDANAHWSKSLQSRLKQFLAEARPHFDIIVIAVGPLLESWDYLRVCEESDGIVMVVEAGKTQAPAVQHAMDRIEGFGGSLLGFVLNGSSRDGV